MKGAGEVVASDEPGDGFRSTQIGYGCGGLTRLGFARESDGNGSGFTRSPIVVWRDEVTDMVASLQGLDRAGGVVASCDEEGEGRLDGDFTT